MGKRAIGVKVGAGFFEERVVAIKEALQVARLARPSAADPLLGIALPTLKVAQVAAGAGGANDAGAAAAARDDSRAAAAATAGRATAPATAAPATTAPPTAAAPTQMQVNMQGSWDSVATTLLGESMPLIGKITSIP
jgi:hypothetical protein